MTYMPQSTKPLPETITFLDKILDDYLNKHHHGSLPDFVTSAFVSPKLEFKIGSLPATDFATTVVNATTAGNAIIEGSPMEWSTANSADWMAIHDQMLGTFHSPKKGYVTKYTPRTTDQSMTVPIDFIYRDKDYTMDEQDNLLCDIFTLHRWSRALRSGEYNVIKGRMIVGDIDQFERHGGKVLYRSHYTDAGKIGLCASALLFHMVSGQYDQHRWDESFIRNIFRSRYMRDIVMDFIDLVAKDNDLSPKANNSGFPHPWESSHRRVDHVLGNMRRFTRDMVPSDIEKDHYGYDLEIRYTGEGGKPMCHRISRPHVPMSEFSMDYGLPAMPMKTKVISSPVYDTPFV